MRIATVCLAVTLFAGVVHAEQVENPSYALWSKYGVGSSTQMSGESEAMGQKTEMNITTTLLESTADKIVIEIKTQIKAAGQTMNVPAQKSDVPKMIEKTKIPANVPTGDATAKASEDTVTVPAGTFKCKKVELNSTANGMTMKGTNWFSDEVPGGMVKMVMNGEGAMKSATTMQLLSVTKK